MQVRILGASAARPNPGAACSGYLVTAGDTSLLVDCGPGVLANLSRHRQLAELDAIILSHGHPDHCLDMVMVRQALMYAPDPKPSRPLPVHVGPGVDGLLDRLGEVFFTDDQAWGPDLRIQRFDPDRALKLGDIDVSFGPTQHFVPCWAMRLTSGGRVLVYTADTGPVSGVVELARGADVLIAEATVIAADGDPSQRGHLTPEEAGALAAEAGAGRLVLTHYFTALGPDRLRARAADAFGGPVDVAREGDIYDV